MCKVESGSSLKPHIRLARKEDLAALLDLEDICFKEEKFHKKQLTYLLAKSFMIVATVEGSIIASIIILLRNHIAHARIYSLNVHPAYRRTGIARLLMDTSLKFLKEKGVKTVTLEVGINNNAAKSLYDSKGFFVDKKLEKYYKSGEDALHLIKKL